MPKALVLLIVILAGLAGMSVYPHSGINGVLAGVVGFLFIEFFSLRRRIGILEAELRKAAQPMVPEAQRAAGAPEDVNIPRPSAEAPDPDAPNPATWQHTEPRAVPVPPPPSGKRFLELFSPVIGFITGGNPVLKIGIVILFFGVAFLLKYAAQRNLIPIELRLVGVALAGLGLLVTGWFLRRTHTNYGLGLEGGGIGILYLVVFAAAKLYQLLPLPLALALMIGLVGLSCALAVLQESKGLAISGSIGGFLAPVLMSTGGGSHVLLFSYYALLNSGILGIAWFKAWRELNLVGFLFTFGIATLWGASAYTPAHFATTEPFLLFFFLMYALISVLFALRQPLQLRGFIDGPLVFGLPIVTIGLQAYLVRDFRFGMALSALAFGCWYIGLARLLWHKMSTEMRLLIEAFLALGVVFASLAIPLGLDPQWTTVAWALEGAAMIWVGLRQERRLARLFGMLLQLGAALTFADKVFYPWEALLFGNHFFLGCALMAFAALFSSYQLETNRDRCRPWEAHLGWFFFIWGWLWWYFGGIRDLNHHLLARHLPAAVLLFTCCTTLAAGFVARRLPWQRLTCSLLLLLPMMGLTIGARLLFWGSGSLLADFGLFAWPLAIGLQYRLLAFFEKELPQKLVPLWHILSLWTVILAVTIEIAWLVGKIPGLAHTWSATCWGLVPVVLLFMLTYQGHRLAWPVQRFAAAYHGPGAGMPVFALLLWCLFSLKMEGNPWLLPYLPVLNPLELTELAVLLLAAIRLTRRPSNEPMNPGHLALTGHCPPELLAVLFFLWLNTVTARTIHVFANIPYTFGTLFDAAVFQAAIAGLWSILAMAMTIWGARKAQRKIWLAGAILLAMVVLKLFLIDLSGAGTIGRIVSFLVVGVLMLIIGFFAPLPPKTKETS
jgi:uncharacterized membrane protein